MHYFDWVALIVGTGLIASGVLAVRRRRVSIPRRYEGSWAVRLGWVWIGMGALFIIGVLFDVGMVKSLFRLFCQAAN